VGFFETSKKNQDLYTYTGVIFNESSTGGEMSKFSNRTRGIRGRRERALERLQKIQTPNAREKKEIEVLAKRVNAWEVKND
tara:strand:+ start:905 stop:1147 length:243 start_codon:yes stop_codon:yes gene_type:complete